MKFISFLPLLGILFLSASPVYSEDSTPAEAYGMVKSISNNQMVVTVYDVQKAQAREETFALAPETQLTIVRPATEVIEGDEVKVTYQETKGTKKASFVSIIDLPAPSGAQAQS